MLPFHGLIFSGMVNRIVAVAEGNDEASQVGPEPL
jgi:hypothetical protein